VNLLRSVFEAEVFSEVEMNTDDKWGDTVLLDMVVVAADWSSRMVEEDPYIAAIAAALAFQHDTNVPFPMFGDCLSKSSIQSIMYLIFVLVN